MRKFFFGILLLAAAGCILLSLTGMASGSRQTALIVFGVVLLCCGFDGLFSRINRIWVLAWAGIWIGILWELLNLISGAVPFLQAAAGAGWRFSFFFWLSLFFGIVLRGSLFIRHTGRNIPTGRTDLTENPVLSFLQRWKIEILILLITALSLKPLLHSGYYWDDAVNSTAYLFEKFDDLPLIQNILIFIRKYLELGRINILSSYYYFLFYIENVSVYKAVIIGLVCADVLLFGLVVREACGSRRISQFSMLLIPALIQFRAYQDPVTGFYGLMQVILIELLLTVYFLLRYLHTARKKYFIFSLIPFLIGLLTYEVCYPFILMIPLIVLLETRDWRKSIRLSIPYGVVTLLLLGAVFIVRMQFAQDSTYAGVAFSPNPELILQTYGYQVFAGLPLSFYFAGKQLAILGTSYLAPDVLHYRLADFLAAIDTSDLLIAVLILVVLAWILRSRTDEKEKLRLGTLFGIGAAFWLLPAVTIAVSQRYQGQLYAGLGYLPVYLEYFGVSILIVWLGIVIFSKVRSAVYGQALKLLMVCTLLLVTVLNQQNNRTVIELMNRGFLYPREAGEKALEGGLLAFLPENVSLLSVNPEEYIWEANWLSAGLYPEYYSIYSGRDLSSEGIETFDLQTYLNRLGIVICPYQTDEQTLKPENLYMLTYDGDSNRGLAKLGKVNQMRLNAAETAVTETLAETVLYFVRGDLQENAQITYQTSDGRTIRLDTRDGWQVRRSADGILYQLPEKDEIIFETLDFYGF